MRFFRDADAPTAPNSSGRFHRASKPKGPGSTEVHAVKAPINTHGRGRSPRAAAEIIVRGVPAATLHEVDSFQRFQSSKKHCRPDALRFTRDIERVPIPINEIDVGVSAL